jgi:hypothetical protein
MGFIKGLTNIGVDTNPKYMGQWHEKVGAFILNFANIELITYQYLNVLEATEEGFNKNIDSFLSARIDRVTRLLDQTTGISNDVKAEMLTHWSRVKELSKWRNRIAHNPVLPTWKPGSDSNHSPPDVLGIPDMKQMKKTRISNSISIEAMDALISDTFGLAHSLITLMKLKIHNSNKTSLSVE